MVKNNRRFLTVFVCAALALLLLGGCGKRTETTNEEPPAVPEIQPPSPAAVVQPTSEPTPEPTPEPEETQPEATPTPEPLSILYNNGVVNSVTVQAGADFTLTADTHGAEGEVTFSSDNAEVASCDAGGHVTALTAGTASITASLGEMTSVCKITVTEAPAPRVTICFWSTPQSDFTLNAAASETIQLTAQVSPQEAADQVVWSMEDPSIAEVSETGLVTALKEGTTKVICTCGNGRAECIVRVRGVRPTYTPVAEETTSDEPALVITYAGYLCSDVTLSVGEGIDLSYKLYNAQNSGAVWSVENPNVATVDQNGYVTAVSAGTTKLTCSCGGMTAECIVRVK